MLILAVFGFANGVQGGIEVLLAGGAGLVVIAWPNIRAWWQGRGNRG